MLLKVSKGSGTTQAILESLEGSLIGMSMLPSGARSSPYGKFGFAKEAEF
jgi:hypothetical protein